MVTFCDMLKQFDAEFLSWQCEILKTKLLYGITEVFSVWKCTYLTELTAYTYINILVNVLSIWLNLNAHHNDCY